MPPESLKLEDQYQLVKVARFLISFVKATCFFLGRMALLDLGAQMHRSLTL